MFVFLRWGNGDVITQAKYVGISGLITVAFSLLFGFLFLFWYLPICAAQVVGYMLVLAGVFRHEPKFLLFAKCILAITIPISGLLAVLFFFVVIFSFGYFFYTFVFIIFIGIIFTGFSVFIVHRAHQAMLGGNQATAHHPPMPPPPQYPPPPYGYGVNPSDPGRY